MPVLTIPTTNNVDDAEMIRWHGDEIHLQLKDRLNNNELEAGTENA